MLVVWVQRRAVQANGHWNMDQANVINSRERRILVALAQTAIPPGRSLPGGGPADADRMDEFLARLNPRGRRVYRAALWTVECSTLGRFGRPFSTLSKQDRWRALSRWERSRIHAWRYLLRVILAPIKLTHFDAPELFELAGCKYHWPTVKDEQPRWLRQVQSGREIDEDLRLQCEVVVIGTGAGGAATAYELAARGRAVLLLEEGDYHRRSNFHGRPTAAFETMYRDRGMAVSFGNVTIPMWSGRAVGGTTVINSGTCYRAPEHTLSYWRNKYRLPQVFSSQGLAPYYERAEAMLQVTAADPKYVAKTGEIIGRGAERLGLRHGVVSRNAPDCDGQGVCCLGCPTGAKRSTDISYVPAALNQGAQLITAAKVERVDIVAGRARGVTAKLRSGRTLRVEAQAVVVAAGTLMTPLLLRTSGACKTSGWLGNNLAVHPACKVLAVFDETVDMANAIPQGYAIDHFMAEGLMFEGGSVPLDLATLAIPWTGPRFTALMEQYSHLAMFGFMVQDHSRGFVRRGLGGHPLVYYRLKRRDLEELGRGLVILCEVFQAAGARRVLPMIPGHDEVTTSQQLSRLRAQKLRAGDLDLAGFHLLGTCRLGTDPSRSCLGPEHQAHDVESLYVCDGSAIPSSLGVNPQMTIMALALRAAEIIVSRLG